MRNIETPTATTTPLTNPYRIGDGVTLCGYSDRAAYTVTATTRTTITIQRDKATLLNGHNSQEADALKFYPGGFSGHTTGEQRYSYERNPEGGRMVCRMRKQPRKVWKEITEGKWGHVYLPDFKNGSSSVISGRHEHYDFNF